MTDRSEAVNGVVDPSSTKEHVISSQPIVPFSESIMANCKNHSAHCMVYADWEEHLLLTKNWPAYPTKAAILMQMRFDGQFGFPGGEVDDSLVGCSEEQSRQIIVDALNRELEEEMNIDRATLSVAEKDYLFTHRHPSRDAFMHFYACKVPLTVIQKIERDFHLSRDFGSEVMGIFRIPLYTMSDEYRGFPVFLKNCFAGNARSQLVLALKSLGVMTSLELNTAINSSKKIRS